MCAHSLACTGLEETFGTAIAFRRTLLIRVLTCTAGCACSLGVLGILALVTLLALLSTISDTGVISCRASWTLVCADLLRILSTWALVACFLSFRTSEVSFGTVFACGLCLCVIVFSCITSIALCLS